MDVQSSFLYRDGALCCEEVRLEEIARREGTPCYVYSRQAFVAAFHHLGRVFAALNPLICYAVKANSNLAVLDLMRSLGAGFDVVSGGELFRLSRVGAEPSKTVFSGVGKSGLELERALELDLLGIHVESLGELKVLCSLARRRERSGRVGLRLNPDVEAATHPHVSTGLRQHKFGLSLGDVEPALELLSHSPLRLTAVGVHIGSQIMDPAPFCRAFSVARELADRLKARGIEIEHLDLGGGFGIPYAPGEEPLDLEAYARFLEREAPPYRIILEPGRFLSGAAGVLLTRVLYRKRQGPRRFLIVDAAMNDLIRPVLYGAYHALLPLSERGETERVDVVGPVCETGDFLARDRVVARMEEGEFLALMTAGAYGFAAASNYNSRPRPSEILVEGSRWRVVRRRESLEDLVRAEQPE